MWCANNKGECVQRPRLPPPVPSFRRGEGSWGSHGPPILCPLLFLLPSLGPALTPFPRSSRCGGVGNPTGAGMANCSPPLPWRRFGAPFLGTWLLAPFLNLGFAGTGASLPPPELLAPHRSRMRPNGSVSAGPCDALPPREPRALPRCTMKF